jgi:biopolymer transport protein ExbD
MLVLLVIFMVAAPVKTVGLRALVPQPPDISDTRPPDPNVIVLTVESDGSVSLNQEPVRMEDLKGRLVRIFENRGDSVVFVRGKQDLRYYQVAQVIDIARGAGLTRVALMTM